MSYIPVTPPPIAVKVSPAASAPVDTPTITESTIPVINTRNTLKPTKAPTSTTTYGRICHTL